MSLEQEFYEWLKDYMDQDEARGLSKILYIESQKYTKYIFGIGVALGIGLTVLILMWAR